MKPNGVRWLPAMLLVLTTFAFAADQPSVDVLKQALDKRLQSLRPTGFTERNVLFQEVRAGRPNGALYPFQVTLLVRDYGPGYPANNFYGETCVGRLGKETFNLRRDEFGDWLVEGRMTPNTEARQCKKNPSAGATSIPLASLQGSVAPSGPAAKPAASAPAAKSAGLPTGEWGCYGAGGGVLFGFFLQSDGTYLDGDRKKAGSYSYNAAGGTVAFRGGPMDGQSGKNTRGRSFELSRTVTCEARL
jgi:hypothetical protein